MKPGNDFDKRKLLLEAFSGNLSNVKAYKEQIQNFDSNGQEGKKKKRSWVMVTDNRTLGGKLTVKLDGVEQEMTQEEFEKLNIPRNSIWATGDFSMGLPHVEPDEDYRYENGTYTYSDGRVFKLDVETNRYYQVVDCWLKFMKPDRQAFYQIQQCFTI